MPFGRKHTISVVIPTYNEEGNIEPLIYRLHYILRKVSAQYEIIFIDDYSTDQTVSEITSLQGFSPIRLYSKLGKPGKAQSLIEGIAKAKYELIVMIDADLQYPPEAIEEMVKEYDLGFDIIVASRRQCATSFLRKFFSKSFNFIFAHFLHGFSVDVQSGLKLFKKNIFSYIQISPDPWTFDLEFLIKVRSAGLKISSVPISFKERLHGKSKVKIIEVSKQIGASAIKLKLQDYAAIIPLNSTEKNDKGNGFYHNGEKYIPHTDLSIRESAFFQLTKIQIIFITFIVLLFMILLFINLKTGLVLIITILTSIYFSDIFFNLYLITRSLSKNPEVKINILSEIEEKNWPSYTILCPLYKEWEVLPQFIRSIAQLNYPKNKLQVLLLFEEDDKQTIEKAQSFNLPYYFEVVTVPNTSPKTKPKACNYGLQKATGEFIVIYDAEDIPEPDQLKKAIEEFEKADPKVVCIQAKLNFYNPYQNILTRLFTAEYSLWFDLILPGLQSLDAPIPLGGTSNHFRTKTLRSLKGWDSFNVTEDCDLGVRLAKKGYLTSIIDSTTYEEANSDFKNWFWQRTRWIKGYTQTFLVHNRNLQDFFKSKNTKSIPIFQLVVGAKILSMLINPLMWLLTILYFADRSTLGIKIESLFPTLVLYLGVISLIFGNFLYLYYYMIGCAKRRHFELAKYGLLAPLYWILMSAAAWVSIYKLIKQPHYWSKTIHGLHLKTTSQKKTHATNLKYSYSM